MTDRMRSDGGDNALGTYLKDRQEKLGPSAFGFALGRRHTGASGRAPLCSVRTGTTERAAALVEEPSEDAGDRR